MSTIAHREMRKNSSEILRRVAAGETIEVTNNGALVAVLVPPKRAAIRSTRTGGGGAPAATPRGVRGSQACERPVQRRRQRRPAWRPVICYVATSAALKPLVEEAEPAALAAWLGEAPREFVASMLLFTELRCAAARHGAIAADAVTDLLDMLALVDLERADLMRAGTSGWGLRSADAIHLAVALRLQVDALVAYDEQLCAAAKSVGLEVVRPGG